MSAAANLGPGKGCSGHEAGRQATLQQRMSSSAQLPANTAAAAVVVPHEAKHPYMSATCSRWSLITCACWPGRLPESRSQPDAYPSGPVAAAYPSPETAKAGHSQLYEKFSYTQTMSSSAGDSFRRLMLLPVKGSTAGSPLQDTLCTTE